MKVKEESGKVGLNLNIQKTKNNGKSDRLSFLGFQNALHIVTATMKLRLLLLGRKAMTNLDSILKNRDVTLPTKVCLVKAVVFLVAVYRCDLSSRSLILLAIGIPSCSKDLF